nr:homeodomain transcription factor bE [Pseudozyma flocculosa]
MFSLSSLQVQLTDIERGLLSGESNDVSPLVDGLQSLKEKASLSIIGKAYDQRAIDKVRQSASRIQEITAARLQLDERFGAIYSKMLQEASVILEDPRSFKVGGVTQGPSQAQPYYHLRKYFLENLHHPYPREADKKALVTLTNEFATCAEGRPVQHSTITVEKLTSWFINARRRSGWSDIMKHFARNEKQLMKLLVQTNFSSSDHLPNSTHPTLTLDELLSKNLGRPLTAADKKKFEDDWASMISWIKYGVRDKVGDWIHQLVLANKKTPKPSPGRAVTMAAKRSPVRKTPNAKPRKPKQRASKTPSLDSNTDSSFLESTPELSMCSTADTSLSSFANTFSTRHYDPVQLQNDLLQSPTLNAKGSRRVKGLPKRAQQPCLPEPLCSDAKSALATSTCFPVPEDRLPPVSAHTQVDIQTASYLPTQQNAYPLFDALGQVPMPIHVIHRESFGSNSLSAAFG